MRTFLRHLVHCLVFSLIVVLFLFLWDLFILCDEDSSCPPELPSVSSAGLPQVEYEMVADWTALPSLPSSEEVVYVCIVRIQGVVTKIFCHYGGVFVSP